MWASVHSKTKYVFSRTPKHDGKAAYISTDIAATVTKIKEQEGKDIWLYGGAQLISTFIGLGLIDLYRLSVHPTVLGKGKPLFEGLSKRLNLSLTQVNTFTSGVVQLIYAHKS